MELDYKGYLICRNNYNYHISIYKDNKLCMHLSFTERVSDSDLFNIIELYLIRDDYYGI